MYEKKAQTKKATDKQSQGTLHSLHKTLILAFHMEYNNYSVHCRTQSSSADHHHVQQNRKEYKGRTDSNSPTSPNEAVQVAILYYYSVYLIETKRQPSGMLNIAPVDEVSPPFLPLPSLPTSPLPSYLSSPFLPLPSLPTSPFPSYLSRPSLPQPSVPSLPSLSSYAPFSSFPSSSPQPPRSAQHPFVAKKTSSLLSSLIHK